jgi:hypothetical protein
MAGRKIFEGLGPSTLIPQRAKAVPEDASIGAEEGFVLSRVDGRTSLEEICLLVPFDEKVTQVILRRLHERGAIDVPGVARTIRPATPVAAIPARPAAPAPPLEDPSNPLSAAQRARIDRLFAELDTRDAFALLELERTAEQKDIKRAYFKLSKEFHPDRFYGRDIGAYGEKLSKIFQAVKAAYEVLSHPERRAAYLESLAK